nr:hypothetical protein CFP56_31615 [Quercus suber]
MQLRMLPCFVSVAPSATLQYSALHRWLMESEASFRTVDRSGNVPPHIAKRRKDVVIVVASGSQYQELWRPSVDSGVSLLYRYLEK